MALEVGLRQPHTGDAFAAAPRTRLFGMMLAEGDYRLFCFGIGQRYSCPITNSTLQPEYPAIAMGESHSDTDGRIA